MVTLPPTGREPFSAKKEGRRESSDKLRPVKGFAGKAKKKLTGSQGSCV